MSYTKMQIAELIIAFVGFVIFGITIHFYAIGPSLIVALAMIAAICLAEYFRGKRYPQWRGLRWKMPKILIFIAIVGFLIFACLDIYFACSDDDILDPAWLLIILLLMNYHTIYYAKKYELDKYSSIEELVEAHPEVKEKLQKPVIE